MHQLRWPRINSVPNPHTFHGFEPHPFSRRQPHALPFRVSLSCPKPFTVRASVPFHGRPPLHHFPPGLR